MPKNAHKTKYLPYNLNILPYQNQVGRKNMKAFNTNTTIVVCIHHLRYKYRPYLVYTWCKATNNDISNYCKTIEENIKNKDFNSFKEYYIITI